MQPASLSKLELPDYYFYDLNLKLTQNPSPNDKVMIAGYKGSDNLDLTAPNGANSVGIEWGNRAASSEWVHVFSDELFSKVGLSASNFSSVFSVGSSTQPFTWDNGIDDYTARTSFEYFPNQQHTLKAGLQATLYHVTLQIQSGDNPPNAAIDKSPFYAAVYLQDEWKPSIEGAAPNPLAINAGIRVDKITSHPQVGIDRRLSARYFYT